MLLKNKVCIEEITHFIKFKLVKPAHALQEKNVQIFQIPLEVYSKRKMNHIIYFYKISKGLLGCRTSPYAHLFCTSDAVKCAHFRVCIVAWRISFIPANLLFRKMSEDTCGKALG